MKKMVLYLCTGMLIFGLTACGKDVQGDSGSQGTEQTGSSDNQQESSGNSQENSEDASGSSADDTDGQPETGGDGSEDGQPEADGQEGWSQEMEGAKAAVLEVLGENYWPSMALDPEMLEMMFGITSDMYEDYMGETPMMSAHVDTLVIVKAKEGQLDAVREALEAYREAQINDTLQYPMNLGKIQASRVEVAGSYVIFTMLGGDDTAVTEEGEEAQLAYCQEKNELVINAIKGELGL